MVGPFRVSFLYILCHLYNGMKVREICQSFVGEIFKLCRYVTGKWVRGKQKDQPYPS